MTPEEFKAIRENARNEEPPDPDEDYSGLGCGGIASLQADRRALIVEVERLRTELVRYADVSNWLDEKHGGPGNNHNVFNIGRETDGWEPAQQALKGKP